MSIKTFELPDALILLHSQAPAVKVWFDEQVQRLRFTEINLEDIYARPIEPAKVEPSDSPQFSKANLIKFPTPRTGNHAGNQGETMSIKALARAVLERNRRLSDGNQIED